MHWQLLGEFHHQTDHERVVFPAIFQEICHPARIGDWSSDTIEHATIHLDIHNWASQDVTVPVRFGATPRTDTVSPVNLFILERRHITGSGFPTSVRKEQY